VAYRGVPYRLYSHAAKRLKERRIDRRYIRQVLDAPDTDVPSKEYPGRRVLSKQVLPTLKVTLVIVPPRKKGKPVGVVTGWRN